MKLKFPLVIDVAYNNATTKWNPVTKKDDVVPPNWSAPISPFPDAIICKASESVYEDNTFGSNWLQLGQLGVPRAAYHFYRNTLLASSGKQAKFFVNTINKYGGLKPGDVLVGDFEEEGKMSMSQTLDWLYNVELLTGIRPLIYSRTLLLNGMSSAKLNSVQISDLKRTLIWVAGTFNDKNQVDNFTTVPSVFIPDQKRYGKVVMWQYGLDINQLIDTTPILTGIPGGLDFDWIDPDFFADWKAQTGGVPQPVPDPDPSPLVTVTSATVEFSDGRTQVLK